MKYNIIVEHVPTGKTWSGEQIEHSTKDFEEAEEFVRMLVKGELNHINFTCDNKEIFLNKHILKDCAIYLVKES